MTKAVEGTCKLCGKHRKLTFEHVPPERAFNAAKVKELPYEEVLKTITGSDGRMPWEFEGLKGKFNQRGSGGYYLCEECNNNTGSWYVQEYVRFVKTLHFMIPEEGLLNGNYYNITIDIHPLQIYKALMTMFCDINNQCFGDESVRQFLLNKKSKELDTKKYSIYLYLAKNSMRKASGLMVKFMGGIGMVLCSEITSYPVGAVLYIDKDKEIPATGICINNFLQVDYDDIKNYRIYNMPCLEINTLFPLDYRTKEEITQCAEDAKKWSEEYE